MPVPSLGQEDALDQETATPSSILGWKIPWTEEPGGLQSMRSQRVRHDWLSMHSMQATNQMVTGEAKESEVGNTRGTVVSSCRWGKAVENLFSFENISSEGVVRQPNKGVQ